VYARSFASGYVSMVQKQGAPSLVITGVTGRRPPA